MEELFRFVALRSAQTVDNKQVVSVAAPTQFQEELAIARAGENPREVMTRIAQEYVASANYVKDISTLTYHQAFPSFFTEVNREEDNDLNLARLQFLINDQFKLSPAQLVANQGYQTDKARIFDSIIAIKIALINQPSPMNDLAHFALVTALIERVAANDKTLDRPGVAHEALQRIIALPAPLFPLPPPSAGAPGERQPGDGSVNRGELKAKVARLSSAIVSLMGVDAADFTPVPPPVAADGSGDGSVNRGELEAKVARLSSAIVSLIGIDVADAASTTVASITQAAPRVEATTIPAAVAAPPAAQNGSSPPIVSHVSTGPQSPLLTLKAETVQRFDPEVKDTLANLNIDLSTTPVPTAVARLKSELLQTTTALNAYEPIWTRPNVFRIGNQYINAPALNGAAVPAAAPVDLPTTHGDIKPVGIGDLLVVRQQLKRYEAGEISYIENVLKSESRKRETRRSTTTEQTFLTETETTKEEERDLQTTERFELKNETDTTIKEDTSLKVGVAVSASYGTFLQVKSNLDVATNDSKEVATKQATSYSKDVTNRAASKVTERVLQRQTLKIVEQFEETNEHGFDNTNGKEHIVGIYQWVDKIYEAQVFNYGKRLLFDVMVPEPAAFLLDALIVHQAEGVDLVKPAPFTITPDQLTEANYYSYVSQYQATGIDPPPLEFVAVAKVFDEHGDKTDAKFSKSIELALPDDYIAIVGTFDWAFIFSDDKKDQVFLDVSIGENVGSVTSATNSPPISFSLNEDGSIPVTLVANDILSYAVGIEVVCKRTPHAFTKWQLATHAKIMQAYLKLLGDYEDKLAALAVQQGVQISSHNPALNRELEQTELKKACLSLLTATHLDFFSGIEESPGPKKYPQVDLTRAEAEGNYIRFFEQAFEWEQMMYFFYPYFWGRKPNWYERVLLDDTDTTFAEFLKAGAGRVVFPVRPGFESAIINFLDTGEILNFNDVDVSSPFYVPIIQEIKESEQAPGKEVAQGDPWDVRIPTTLVRLRPDATLPSWTKNAQGEWIPQ